MSDKHILISDWTQGGAATACRRLLAALTRGASANAQWIAAMGEGDGQVVVADRWPDMISTLAYRVALRLRVNERIASRLSSFIAERNAMHEVRGFGPDLINVHNIHGAMTFAFVEKLSPRVPIVWTLHDMWPLSGYCWVNYECGKYADGCTGECPEAGNWGPALCPPDREWLRREKFYRRNARRMAFVGPSKWMADCARKRWGDMIRVEHIPNSINLSVFKPIADKAALRRILDLPMDSKIVLAGSADLTEGRKGIKYLVEAAGMMKEKMRGGFVVVTFGRCKDASELPEGWKHFGEIRDEQLLNLLYNAADVFVLPSLWDNLPNTLVEATAAGTPCVTFDTGGCPEVVRDGQTGFVAEYKDSQDLAACIERVLMMPADEYERMSAECRRVAEAEYAPELQAQRYIALFEEMTSRQLITEDPQQQSKARCVAQRKDREDI